MRHRTTLVVVAAFAVLVPAPALAQESSSPHPTPATPHRDCYTQMIDRPTEPVDAWGLDGKGGATFTVQGDPDSEHFGPDEATIQGYVRPGTERRELGRAATDDQARATVSVPLTGNARLHASGAGCPFSGVEYVVLVKARLGALHAHRNGPRDYTFSTFYAGPDGKVGNLYRVLPDGREILTSQTRMRGELVTIRRVFLGSGRFGFVLRSGDDINSLGASTAIRATVIH